MLSSLKRLPAKKKHKKLSDNWLEAKPVVIEGMSYTSKYIGMTLVDSPKGEEMAAGAIKRIVTSSKASTQEIPLVRLTVSPKGIKIKNLSTDEIIDDIDITRISYCTADKTIGKVFGYVIQNPKTESFECHAYMCSSRKEAQKVALTVAQSFSIAYEISNTTNTDRSRFDQIEEEATSSSFSLDNRKISSIYHSVTDTRYKRLSDSFGSNPGVEPFPDAHVNDANEKSVDIPTSLNVPVRDLTEPQVVSSSMLSETKLNKKKQDGMMVAILPPPSSKGRQTAGRVTPRLTPTANLIDISSVFQEKTKQTQDEAESLDLDFAQLALSRTQQTT